ncbi:hypothetical protein TTHERM_00578810 (macronuclear) [Tetrahymena thermophila SB210]|uniref:Uncharacterized protein n=1 Tax=Tetrahymena thermophila (strain SB210) TaxID=312017 RepID=I7MH55_TETTS|nr:hypothetical protein TTHERM_00578810 [Tetrahymena thermophila SB210]EAS02637.2 hypothetical protein TTHERM_00578810 [Tetrahymena thermophila SB210]|eukprot:XP_001022882.2 hypothetical protein TTHERM_00578810 [Tetrahymena thermophila SB210]
MNAAGVRENMNQLAPSQKKLIRNEEPPQSDLNSLQQQIMPSAKRSFSAEGTVKRCSKLRTTVRNEFFNGAKNANPEEDTSQKKTTLVVLKRYNSAFPKDFFGNVRQGNDQVSNRVHQNDSSAPSNQGIVPTGYTYSIRQDSYQFLQQQQQQLGFLNDNQSQQNSKLSRQQMQNLNQSQYLHQNMYSLQQGVKQMMPAPVQFQQQNLSSMQNSLQMINQPFPSSQILQQQQQYKYRCQSEADSPIKKSAYDILENSSRIPQITQSEQKIQYNNQSGPSATHQMYIQQKQQPQQIQYLKNNPINSSQHQNYNQSYLNSNNYPSSSLVSGENSPLKEQKFNNQTSFTTASSQWKHIFTNNQQTQNQIPKIQQFQAANSIIKNQFKARQNIPPKPQFQHQNYAYCKTEQNEDSVQSNSNSITDNPHSINSNNIDMFRNTINNDTPKFTSDDSTTLSSQQNQTNSFTAAIIQQQLMQRVQNNNPSQIINKSQFSNNQTQNEQLNLKIVQQNANAPSSYHIQTKQKRKSQAARSQSEIKLSNSIYSNQNQDQALNNFDKKNPLYEEGLQKSEKGDANLDQVEDKKNNLNYATFSSSSLLKINYLQNEKKKQIEQEKQQISSHQQPTSILQQNLQNNNNNLLNSLQLQQNVNLQQKQQTNMLNSSSGSGEDKLNFNQSRQFFDFQIQMQNESQNGLVQSINGTQNEINILDNKQLLNKDYSCFQFNLQPIPGLQNQALIGQNSYQSYHLNSRNISPEDDRNGKENLINQINNIFQNKANKVDLQHSQKSNYLNILHSQQNGLTQKISSNSSENVNDQNQSSSENKKSSSSIQKPRKQNEEFKEQKYTNEFIDDHIRNSEKLVSRASQIEEESPTEKASNLSRKNSNSQQPKQAKSTSISSSAKKKSRIKVIYPAQMDPNSLNQSSNLRTQSEANLSTRQKKNSIIKPFQCQNNNDNKIDNNANDISEDNFSPVHFHRLNTEADKDSENIQSNYDFSRKVFSVSSFQQLDSNNPDSAQQKKRVRKPKSYHSQQVFNLNSSDTKKKIGFFNYNQEQTTSNNITQIIENTQISNYQNTNAKEKQQQDQSQVQNTSTTTLPKIYTHQNTLSQSKQNFSKQRIRFNSYQKSKTEISPKDEENQNNLSLSNQFQNQVQQKKNNLSQQQQQPSSQLNQKNNQTMKLSDFVSLTEKKQSAGSSDYEQKKTNPNEGNQKEQLQVKANPFLQSNLNPNQFEFSFRNNQCQKESEKQISQQINKHKIQSDSQQSSRNSIVQPNNNNSNQANNNHNNQNQIYEQKSQQHAAHNQLTNQLYNFKLNINNQQPYQSKDTTSIKLSSSQLKQPNKFLSEKKQLISQNLKTDYS